MKNLRNAAMVLVLTIMGGGTVRADIVFDSITGANSTGLLAIAPTSGPLGDSFSTGISASSLSDVKVNFYNPSASTTGSITVSLYASNGVAPTTSIATLATLATSEVAPGTFLVEDFSSFSPIALAANTRYYILLSTTNDSPLDAVVTNDLSGIGVANQFNYFSGSAQSNVSVGGTFEMQVSTTPTVVVPLPASIVMMGVGLASSWLRSRRNSRGGRPYSAVPSS